VLIAAIVMLGACAPSGVEPAAEPGTQVVSRAPAVDAAGEVPPSPERLVPQRLDGDVVVIPRVRFTPMWNAPALGSPPDFRLDTRNAQGRLAPLLVEDAGTLDGATWYEVLLPIRPNGTTAWVRADEVLARERTERIVVDLSRRLLWHYAGDRLVDRFRVGVGTPATPTGTGRFYVWVKVTYDDPAGPYGSAALGLSGFSPVLSEWPGQGRMAVHGTADPGDRGRAVSHGCVRVYNAELEALLDVPLGTPVVIRA
jgi:hypothetical protein